VQIGQTVNCRHIVIFKLLWYRPPPSWISLDLKLTDQTATRAELRHRAKFCWNCGRDMAIFQNGSDRHFGFLKLQSSNCGTHHKCRIASPCQISWRLVKPLSRYLDFGFLKMFAATSLDFYILTIRTVKKDELRHCAKFCRNRLIRGWDMAIFRFFILSAAAILDFWNFKFLTVGTVKRVELPPPSLDFFRSQICNGPNGHKGRTAPLYQILLKSLKLRAAAKIWRFFDFSKWRRPTCWIFGITKF